MMLLLMTSPLQNKSFEN